MICKRKALRCRLIVMSIIYLFPENELVTLTILKSEISHIYAHFGRTMPLLFIFCHGHACARIRSSLKMTSKSTGLWFDVDCNGK